MCYASRKLLSGIVKSMVFLRVLLFDPSNAKAIIPVKVGERIVNGFLFHECFEIFFLRFALIVTALVFAVSYELVEIKQQYDALVFLQRVKIKDINNRIRNGFH